MAQTKNPALYDTCFDKYMIPSLKDFVDRDGKEMAALRDVMGVPVRK